jgi:hypothetical protein
MIPAILMVLRERMMIEGDLLNRSGGYAESVRMRRRERAEPEDRAMRSSRRQV